jgi:hypothetical protein
MKVYKGYGLASHSSVLTTFAEVWDNPYVA